MTLHIAERILFHFVDLLAASCKRQQYINGAVVNAAANMIFKISITIITLDKNVPVSDPSVPALKFQQVGH